MPRAEAGGGADVQLARTFAEIARVLVAEAGVQATLDRIAVTAVSTVDGCEGAGISVVERGRIHTAAASDDLPRRVDAIQYEVGEGPCLDAIKDHDVFHTDDLSRERRWPHFAARAAQETGVRSVVAFRLFVDHETMGAVNLFSTREAAFDDDDVRIGTLFAAHAAVALSAARKEEQLEHAVASRDVIGQAKGILMVRENVDEHRAFEILIRASQRLNVKLREVAARVVGQDEPGLGAQGD